MTPFNSIAYRVRMLATTLHLEALLAGKQCTEEQARAEAARQVAAEERLRSPPLPSPDAQAGDARGVLFARLRGMAANMAGPPPAGASLMERFAFALYGTEHVNPAPLAETVQASSDAPDLAEGKSIASKSSKSRDPLTAPFKRKSAIERQPQAEAQVTSSAKAFPLSYGDSAIGSPQFIPDDEFAAHYRDLTTANWRRSIERNLEIQRRNGRR